MEEEQQGLKESSLEFKLKDRKETRGREERGREKESSLLYVSGNMLI